MTIDDVTRVMTVILCVEIPVAAVLTIVNRRLDRKLDKLKAENKRLRGLRDMGVRRN